MFITEVGHQNPIGVARGVVIPAAGIAFVVVGLKLLEKQDVHPLLAKEQRRTGAVGNIRQPPWVQLRDRAHAIRVVTGTSVKRRSDIVVLRMGCRFARIPRRAVGQVVVPIIRRQNFRRPARGTEHDLQRRADGLDGFFEIDGLSVTGPQLLLFDERQDLKTPAAMLLRRDLRHAVDVAHVVIPARPTGRGQDAIRVGVILSSKRELLQMIHALRSAGRFPRGLHGGQQQGDQNANDGDDDEEFNKRERAAS
jgi:hypothetical protein